MAGDPAGYSAALWKEMVDLGWTGLAVPEEHGGVGEGFLEVCLLFEQLGYALVPTPLPVTVACCALPIARHGTDAQKSEWLDAISRGRIITCTPPAWDRPASAPIATPADSGDGFVIDGEAQFVPYASTAESILVTAHVDGDGRRAILLDTDTPGLAIEPSNTIGFDRPCRVTFNGVRAPSDRVLGGNGDPVEAIALYGAAAT
ncbi:acyl-CoA dehydrogenase family protein, partial [Actinomadura adrarensis]